METQTNETSEKPKKSKDSSTIINLMIGFIKDEILKSDIRTEIIKPILVYLLYYIIPFVILFIFLNFLATIAAVFLVSYFRK
jgi:hypothetical protein